MKYTEDILANRDKAWRREIKIPTTLEPSVIELAILTLM